MHKYKRCLSKLNIENTHENQHHYFLVDVSR